MAKGWEICPSAEENADSISAVAREWDWSEGLPVPRLNLVCPVCRYSDVQVRQWAFHIQRTSTHSPYRCDVFMKCRICSCLWTHGLVVPAELYLERMNDAKGDMAYRYAEVREMIETTGSPVPPPRPQGQWKVLPTKDYPFESIQPNEAPVLPGVKV